MDEVRHMTNPIETGLAMLRSAAAQNKVTMFETFIEL
jgi:hypothetical protein